jgi:adenosylhomocysteine nucleosidase
MKKIKLFVALESELPKELIPDGVEVYYTGVGKINAAIKATEILSPAYQVYKDTTIVLNYGSAGSKSVPTHSLVECKVFYQEDMDGRPFSPMKTTPFDKEMYPQIGDEPVYFGSGGFVCHTQDKFEQNPKNGVYDMEAYALAKVCKIYGYDFKAYKFISDDGNPDDWEENHHLGIEKFLKKLAEYLENS